jgi:NAD(P)-dependent dehydrogenase (short-subunit alcohol dehydrogenase family)
MKAERVLITGTTAGLGRGLLERYVQRGAKVIAVNRRRVPELEACYLGVRFECLDVRSADAVGQLMNDLHASGELPNILILNAGINRIDNDESFQLSSYKEVIDTNLLGVLNFVEPLTLLPPSALPRHVIAISSMASYVGNPYGLGYHTSKRALTACFDVWSRMYADTDLIFQQVMLGPVRTRMYTMGERFPQWMLWLKEAFSASLDGTVTAVCQLAASRRRKLFYPRRSIVLYLGMWACQALIPNFFRGRNTLHGRARRTGVPKEARHAAVTERP